MRTMMLSDAETYHHYRQWKEKPLHRAPELSVVIPAYNEAERIVPTIGVIASHCSSLGVPWELIVADDGSTDGTAALVRSLGLANLRLLEAAENGGKGSAVRRGILAARGEFILFADADNSTPIEELTQLLARMDEGNDIVIGSRAAAGAAETNRPLLRRLLSGGLRWMVRHLLRVGVADSQCGFKLFRRQAGQHLCRLQTVMGFSFDLELLYLAAKLGYRVAEQPVQWVDAPGSKVSARKEVLRFVKELTRIRINDLRGVYAARDGAAHDRPVHSHAAHSHTAHGHAEPAVCSRIPHLA